MSGVGKVAWAMDMDMDMDMEREMKPMGDQHCLHEKRNKGKGLALIASGSHAFVAAAWISLRSYGIDDDFFQSSTQPMQQA